MEVVKKITIKMANENFFWWFHWHRFCFRTKQAIGEVNPVL